MDNPTVELTLPPIPPLKAPQKAGSVFYDPLAKVKRDLMWFVAVEMKKFPCCPLKGPISVSIRFLFAPPPSWSEKKRKAILGQPHEVRPDIDNLTKTAFDVMKRLVFIDDNQIFEYFACKEWAEESKTLVKIWQNQKGLKILEKSQ